MNEKEKMNLGMWYDANNDKELLEARLVAQDLCYQLNQTRPREREKRNDLLKKILGEVAEGLEILSPFICDYGKNTRFGKNVFVNTNCYFMDGALITVGDNVFIGPSCGFYTASHPLDYKNRNLGLEKALPINIGNNIWFGANVSVMPGVSIGDGCVIGAGSVVTKDIAPNSLACGVPCKVVKAIDNNKE